MSTLNVRATDADQRPVANTLTYSGDCLRYITEAIDTGKSALTFGEYPMQASPVCAEFDPASGKTRVGFTFHAPAEDAA